MKKLSLLALTILLVLPITLFAQEERNWNSLAFSSVGEKVKKSENLIYQQKGFPKFGEFSLRNEDPQKLNAIELSLLEQYDDLRITKYSHGYFLIQGNAIGFATKKGEVLVPPVEGRVRVATGAGYLKQFYLFGEQTEDFDRMLVSINQQLANDDDEIAVPQGLFKAVLKMHAAFASGSSYEPIIEAGRYDHISLVVRSKGSLSEKAGFYVYKQNENGELLCGYCNADGKEQIACEYKSVYFDGVNFRGDNTKSMLEWNEYYAEKTKMKQEEIAARQAVWANALNSFGQGMNAIAQNMGGASSVQTNTSVTSSAKSSASNINYQAEYARWERLAERNYNTLTNLGVQSTEKKDGKAVAESGTSGGVGHISVSNYTLQKKALREAQDEMVRIRQQAAKAGIKIEKSRWETATVSY